VATADGQLLLAQDDVRAACEALRSAVALWLEVGAPYETGCARVRLARALLQSGEQASAALELNSALALLEPLGARPAIEHAHSVMPRPILPP
jgi:hypothetical protein